MAENISIREAIASDVKVLADLLQEHFKFMRNEYLHTKHSLEWPHSQVGLDYIRKFVPGDSTHKSWIAEDKNGKPVGYLLGKIYESSHRSDNPISEIEDIFVIESSRGSGIAKNLIREFNGWSLFNNVKRMKAQTYNENLDAQKVYEALGMNQIEVIYEIPSFKFEE